MLLGKSGTEAIDLIDYSKLSYDFDAAKNCNNDGINHIWSKMLKYTQGEGQDGKLNHFILIQNIKKLIIDAIKKTRPHHELFLENYNIYKSYCFQTFVTPLLQDKNAVDDDKRVKLLVEIISDKSFHQSLRDMVEESSAGNRNPGFCKNFETYRDVLVTPKPESTLPLQDTQRLAPEFLNQTHADKYPHIKSKVKVSLSPLGNSNRKYDKSKHMACVNVGMLTYLSDNDQKRKSFSSEGSDTPEENLRHRGVVLNVNNLFGLQKFNKPISKYSVEFIFYEKILRF